MPPLYRTFVVGDGLVTDGTSGQTDLDSAFSPEFTNMTLTGDLTLSLTGSDPDIDSPNAALGLNQVNNQPVKTGTGQFIAGGAALITGILDVRGGLIEDQEAEDLVLRTNSNANQLVLDSGGNVIINEDGASVDFRVEGDTITSLLHTDGSADKVGVGLGDPQVRFHVHDVSVNGTGIQEIARFTMNSAAGLSLNDGGILYLSRTTAQLAVGIGFEHVTGGAENWDMTLHTTNAGVTAEKMHITHDGKVGIGILPNVLFHVAGAVEIDGALDLDGNIITSAGDLTITPGGADTILNGRLRVVNASAPAFTMIESGVTANNTKWLMQALNETMRFRLLNDAESAAASYFEITRTNNTIDTILIVATTISLLGDGVVTGNLTLPKTSGKGIRVDTTTPTFGFRDILGNVTQLNIGASKPTFAIYRDTLRSFQFAVGKEEYFEFHIPHDYVAGSNIFLHIHWSHISASVTSGAVTFEYEISYSKSHDGGAFPASVTGTVVQTASTTQYKHMLAEGQVSAASPSGSQIDSDDLEPDGVILCRVEVQANSMSASTDPFIHYVDIHYHSTNIATKDKAPNFYV